MKAILKRVLDFLIACHPFVPPLVRPNDEYDPREFRD